MVTESTRRTIMSRLADERGRIVKSAPLTVALAYPSPYHVAMSSLGYQRISLFGASYGTRMAQAYMRRFPDRVRSVVLDGVAPMDTVLPLTYAAGTQRAIIRTVRGWNAERISRDAHLISQPTLLLWGENDREIPLADGERLHAEIPGSRLIVFLKCGHLPHEEYPEAFSNLVTDFCHAKSV